MSFLLIQFSQPSGPIEYDVKTGAPIRYVPVTNSTDEEVEKGSEPSWGKGGRPAVPPAEDWIDCCCNQTGWKNRSGTNWTPPTVKVQVDVVHGPNGKKFFIKFYVNFLCKTLKTLYNPFASKDDTAWKLVRFLTFLTMLFDSCLIVILVVALRNVLKKRVADADVRKQDTNGKIP